MNFLCKAAYQYYFIQSLYKILKNMSERIEKIPEEPMKPEPKYVINGHVVKLPSEWKMRNGGKAVVKSFGPDPHYPIKGEVSGILKTWNAVGQYRANFKNSDFDLIEPWKEEEMKPTEEPAKAEEKSGPNVNGVPIKVGSKWETRDGRMTEVLATDMGERFPVLCRFRDIYGDWSMLYVDERGIFDVGHENPCDLIRPWREERERWIIEWEDSSQRVVRHEVCYCEQTAKDEAASIRNCGDKVIAIKRITFREGEGLE